jgi:hypothetical protein
MHEDEKYRFPVDKNNIKNHSEDPEVDASIILKWIVKNMIEEYGMNYSC